MNQCTNPKFMWVKNLPLIEYTPKPSEEWVQQYLQ
jgi:hypothetical protein